MGQKSSYHITFDVSGVDPDTPERLRDLLRHQIESAEFHQAIKKAHAVATEAKADPQARVETKIKFTGSVSSSGGATVSGSIEFSF